MTDENERDAAALAFGRAFRDLLTQAVAEAIAADETVGGLKQDMQDVKGELGRLADGLQQAEEENLRQDDDLQFVQRVVSGINTEFMSRTDDPAP